MLKKWRIVTGQVTLLLKYVVKLVASLVLISYSPAGHVSMKLSSGLSSCVCTVWVEALMDNPVCPAHGFYNGPTVVVAEGDEVKLFQVTGKSEGTTVPRHKASLQHPCGTSEPGWGLWKRQKMDWDSQKKIARAFGMFLEGPEEKAVQGFKKITVEWASSRPARWVLVCQLIKYTRGCISSVFPSSIPR